MGSTASTPKSFDASMLGECAIRPDHAADRAAGRHRVERGLAARPGRPVAPVAPREPVDPRAPVTPRAPRGPAGRSLRRKPRARSEPSRTCVATASFVLVTARSRSCRDPTLLRGMVSA